ncbi:MAG: hypothetical protein MZV49_07885 [Rhodopseudomonas palustris]|nr:hypothetical protein [Rhodopseudomonas palustris]
MVAVTGLVLACAGAVYGNVFGSGAYPGVGGFEDRFSAAPVPTTNLSAASHVVAKTRGTAACRAGEPRPSHRSHAGHHRCSAR